MKINYVLIDYENVPVQSLTLLKGEDFRVYVFLGPKNNKISADLAIAMQGRGSLAQYIKLDASGNNALDFHITYYLGKLAAADPDGAFYIISKDTGFDSLIAHIKKSHVDCSRAVSIDALPCFAKESNAISKKVKSKASETATAVKQNTSELVERVVANLIKRKSAAPRTVKTLRSTIQNLSGKQYSEKEIEVVFDRLVKKGVVTVEGMKVNYTLPVNTDKEKLI
jgi:predicted transcriptional regulator